MVAVLLAAVLPQVALAETYSAVVTDKTVTVYRDAEMTNRAGSLPKATVIEISEINGNVAQFSYKKQGTYYCAATAVTPVEDIATEAYVSKAGARAYEKAKSSAKSVAAQKGLAVNVLAVSGQWALVECNGYGVYMKKSDLALAENNAEQLQTGVPAEETETSLNLKCTVKADTLPVYAESSKDSTKLGSLKKGADVIVISYDPTWAHISVQGTKGYCATTGLKTAGTAAQTQPQTTEPTAELTDAKKANIEAKVTAASVKVYKKPDTASDLMSTVPNGTTVNVIAYNNSWAYVEKNGYYGYCATSALGKTASSASSASSDADDKYLKLYPEVQYTATVVCENAPVFSASNPSTPFSKLPIATQVDVYASSTKWTYLGIGTSRGFVETKYVSRTGYPEIASGASGSTVKALQLALEKLGYLDIQPDSMYGDATVSAVQRFQSRIGVAQTGSADLITLRVLCGGYAPESPLFTANLQRGQSSSNVQRMQTRLQALGYLSKPTSVDGDFGAITVIALRLFQQQAGLTPDGECSYNTMRALYSSGAPGRPAGTNAADYTTKPSSTYGVTTMPENLMSTQSVLPSNATKVERLEYVIYVAQCQLGKPYIYGTAGSSSFDCSGLTTYCFKKIGITLGRSAYAHGYEDKTGTKITSVNDLKRGDILCFNTIDDSDQSDHVGLYVGNGYFIHASSGDSNGHQVVVSSLTQDYYARVFSWARRPAY